MDKGLGMIADIPSRAGSETILIMSALLVARFCTGLFYLLVARAMTYYSTPPFGRLSRRSLTPAVKPLRQGACLSRCLRTPSSYGT